MLALKGRYDGLAVVFDKKPRIPAGDVIVTFLDSPASERDGAFEKRDDDGSLAYLFKGYSDDGIREPVVDCGSSINNAAQASALS